MPRTPASPVPPLRDAAWHAHLELLCGLPYPAPALMPSVLAALRSGFDADYGAFGWVEGPHLTPVAFWSERMNESVLRFLHVRYDEVFAEFPLRQQLESDGDVARLNQLLPGYEDHWHLREMLAPTGVRWIMGVPVFGAGGGCTGFVYLCRAAAGGFFTDAEQDRLRSARDCLRGLGVQEAAAPSLPGPLRPLRSAVLQLDAQGRIGACTPQAFELLYLCHDARMDMLGWAAGDWSALPAEVRDTAQRLAADAHGPHRAQCCVERAAGRFDFRIDRLQPRGGGDGAPQLAVDIAHLEPVELAVARALLHWPLSPREKRLLVASVRQPGQRELAAQLGITVGTLKSYVNGLQARCGVASRQALIERILAGA